MTALTGALSDHQTENRSAAALNSKLGESAFEPEAAKQAQKKLAFDESKLAPN